MVQFASESFELTARGVSEAEKVEYDLKFPIGVNSDGTVLPSTPRKMSKQDVLKRYHDLLYQDLPVAGLYQIVSLTEVWLTEILRAILVAFPKKMGDKRQVSVAAVLQAKSLQSVQIAATDALLHELTYKSPADFAEAAAKILDFNLDELQTYRRYVEIKATRDIWVHNMGVANETYLRKAASHARVKDGHYLPVNMGYLLQSFEYVLVLVEDTHAKLAETWPPPPVGPLFTADSDAKPDPS